MATILEDWSPCEVLKSAYDPPECRPIVLHGKVFGHPKSPQVFDGMFVQTSRVLSLDLKNNKARTRNTEYTLGTPSRDWLSWMAERGHRLNDYHKP